MGVTLPKQGAIIAEGATPPVALSHAALIEVLMLAFVAGYLVSPPSSLSHAEENRPSVF